MKAKMKTADIKDMESLNRLLKDSGKEIFGPIFWHVLHRRAAKKEISDRWLDAYEKAIPCPFCRAHFQDLRRNIPLHCAASQEFWAFTIHNMVNSKLNKRILSLDEARFIHSSK